MQKPSCLGRFLNICNVRSAWMARAWVRLRGRLTPTEVVSPTAERVVGWRPHLLFKMATSDVGGGDAQMSPNHC